MNALTRTHFTNTSRPARRWMHWFWLTGLLALLTACGSGGGKDEVRIGSGQSNNSGTASGADYPVFYVKRVTPDFSDANNTPDDNIQHLTTYSTKADLWMRDRSSPSATERNITMRPDNELWDIKDVTTSHDGKKVAFAMRGPIANNQDDNEPPYWHIWEYDIASQTLRQLTTGDAEADETQDVAPHYLPDGHIVFSSTRQRQSKAVLVQSEQKQAFPAQDESRRESAFVLHVMDADGQNIEQISFNQSHDTDATVLTNGRILFSRWDRMRGSNRNGIHFYTTKPDGSDTQLLYGANSHAAVPNTAANGTVTYPTTTQYTKAREMPGGKILTLVKPVSGTEFGGDLYVVDATNFVEKNQTLAGNTTSGAGAGKATTYNVQIVTGPSIGGRFVSADPLWDGSGRILISWTQCRVIDPTTQAIVMCNATNVADPAFVAAPPLYSLWILSPTDGTQLPIIVPTAGTMITDIAIAAPRTQPTFLPVNPLANPALDTTLRNEGAGILDIRSVYDFDGAESAVGTGCSIAGNANPTSTCYTNRPARFLRLEKAVSLPSDDVRDIDNNAFGASNYMREILGYIPVEPDGSVRTKVPANVAFRIAITDANGRNVNTFPTHNAWLSIRPGEVVQCNGCHRNSTNVPAGQSGRSHGRSGTFNSVYSGATATTFANANSTFSAVTGQTMAQARALWSCTNEQCASVTPSMNVMFANVWLSTTADSKVTPTTPPRAGDIALVYSGTGGITTQVPTNNSICLLTWSSTCRSTINYLEHIQPVWEKPQGTDLNGDTLVDGNDNCLACHSRTDAASAPRIPAGQLELTKDTSDQNNLRVNSYQELLFTDNELELVNNGATLQDLCIQFEIDPLTGLPTLNCLQFATVPPPLSARNAAGSRFFAVFESNQCRQTNGNITTCTFNHTGLLTPGDLRLISEWVDIGAQYYNDPFKAPVN